ncbi:MAG: NAD(P)-dependent oxidoreductase [Spirochaetes bacterium]|nr:NAD(P)-dependent oxidoreductase [Spirochaetota bacterium]
MVLVTGCGGFLGKKLVTRLLNENVQVRGLTPSKTGDMDPRVELIVGSPLDERLLRKACEGVDTVFHLYDIKGTKHHSRSEMKKTNIQGTRSLLAASERAGVKKFLFLSSYEVYGTTKKIPTRQDDPKRPRTAYGKDKLRAEMICTEYLKRGTMAITVFRPALIIGPGTNNPVVLIALLMALGMREDNRLYVAGNGDTKFQLLHPDDAVEAFVSAMKTPAAAGKIYNLGSDNVMTQMDQTVKIKELAQLDSVIRHLSSFKTKFLSSILRPFKVNYLTKEHVFYLLNNMLLDCQTAKNDLAWEPKRINTEILLETIRWYENEKL